MKDKDESNINLGYFTELLNVLKEAVDFKAPEIPQML